MAIKYTPQALYPTDKAGQDKYLIDELNKISFTLENLIAEDEQIQDCCGNKASECYCIQLCEGDPVDLPQSCSSLQDYYLQDTTWYTFHAQGYLDEYTPQTAGAATNLANDSTLVIATEDYSYPAFRGELVTTNDLMDPWDQCVDQAYTTFTSTTSNVRAVSHKGTTNSLYFGAGDNCTFWAVIRSSDSAPDSEVRSIMNWRSPIANMDSNRNEYDIRWRGDIGRIDVLDGSDSAAVTSDVLKSHDESNNPVWINLVVHIARTTSSLTITVWANGLLVDSASQAGTYDIDNMLGKPEATRYPGFGTAWANTSGGQVDMVHMAFSLGAPSNERIVEQNTYYNANRTDYTPGGGGTGEVVFEVGDVLQVSEVDPITGEATWCPVPMGAGARDSRTFFSETEPTDWLPGDLWGTWTE
jgi:hypothetical protein